MYLVNKNILHTPLKTASECPYGEGGHFTMSRKTRKPKLDKSFRVIPEYHDSIDAERA